MDLIRLVILAVTDSGVRHLCVLIQQYSMSPLPEWFEGKIACNAKPAEQCPGSTLYSQA